MTPSTGAPAVIHRGLVWFMALAAALATAAIYPLQPAVGTVAGSLGTSVAAVGVALAGGPVGYLVGLAVLVPLVDRYPPRVVLAAQLGALSVALELGAISSDIRALGATMVLIGACSSVGAGLSSMVGRLAGPARRATELGIVTAGISAGILVGRIAGGWLADAVGWRSTVTGFAGLCAVAAVATLALLPPLPSHTTDGPLATLAAVPALFRTSRVLREASVRGALWFFAFCAVWSGVAVALSGPPYSLSAERIGLYGLAGIAGVGATRVAGVWTDRVGPARVILVGLATAVGSCLVLALALGSTPLTLLTLALFDAGLFAAQVANQSTVLAIDPAGPARFNSAYMVVYFVGGSLGTGFGAAAADLLGWTAAAAAAVAAMVLAALLTARTLRAERSAHRRADPAASAGTIRPCASARSTCSPANPCSATRSPSCTTPTA